MIIAVFRSLESLRDSRREAVPPDFSLRINPRTRSTEEQLAKLAVVDDFDLRTFIFHVDIDNPSIGIVRSDPIRYATCWLLRYKIGIVVVITQAGNGFHQDTVFGIIEVDITLALLHFEDINQFHAVSQNHIDIINAPISIFRSSESREDSLRNRARSNITLGHSPVAQRIIKPRLGVLIVALRTGGRIEFSDGILIFYFPLDVFSIGIHLVEGLHNQFRNAISLRIAFMTVVVITTCKSIQAGSR